jgi:hypothetical protein
VAAEARLRESARRPDIAVFKTFRRRFQPFYQYFMRSRGASIIGCVITRNSRIPLKKSHQFIYDEKTLRAAVERAGFKKVARRELNESDAAAPRALEDTNRMPERFLRLESFTLEGTKLTAV